MKVKTKGILLGMIGACCYGMNPLFALPLYSHGLGVNSVLFYRYFFAVFIFGIWTMFYKRISLKINIKEALVMFPMGILFSLSSLMLFMSYKYIDAGIASTILFIYPILVAVIMAVFFKEKLTGRIIASIFLTTAGILLFYRGKSNESLSIIGMILVFMSALSYALYMVGIKKIHVIRHLNLSVVTFYVMLFGLFVYIINLKFCTQLQPLNSPILWLCSIALSLFPTIISIETMTISIKIIGPTLSAILGALEPVTAIFFGVIIFNEQLTLRIVFGILLILLAVFLIVLKKKTYKCNC